MRPVPLIAAIAFDFVALAHLLRLVLHVDVTVGGKVLPMWPSILGLVVTAALAVLLLREARRP
jgi:hypothetical protein